MELNKAVPLSQEAFLQMGQLQEIMENMVTSNVPDIWFYIWNTSNFSVKKTYKHPISQMDVGKLLSTKFSFGYC
jgi:hypothetical protein